MYWGHRKLMLPWLFLQGFLASILASLACYYLALFPLKISCLGGLEDLRRRDANFRQHYSPLATASVISSASRNEEEEETSAANSNGSCQPLLWYSVIMILSLLILVYYFYIVQVRKRKSEVSEFFFPEKLFAMLFDYFLIVKIICIA